MADNPCNPLTLNRVDSADVRDEQKGQVALP